MPAIQSARAVRAVFLVAAIAILPSGVALADGDPEAGLTQRQFNDIVRITPPDASAPAVAIPGEIHNLNDAEKAEMDRMHAVKVVRGKEWKRMTPEQRYDRIKTLRETMTGAILLLTVPGGDLWAVPRGENGINAHDILTNGRVRFWTSEQKEAMPVAVAPTQGGDLRFGRRDTGALALGVKFNF